MAHVFFEFNYDFNAPTRMVWDSLVDWKGHEQWIYATHVELHGDADPTQIGAEFTAWSGPMPSTTAGQRLSLEDRMRVDELHYDDTTNTGVCRIAKVGPTLGGEARFKVAPTEQGTRLRWTEDITVGFVPDSLAPLVSRLGALGFRFFMSRLNRQLGRSISSSDDGSSRSLSPVQPDPESRR